MERKTTSPPRSYAVCWVCKRRSVNRELFNTDPFAPIMGVAYRCKELDACSERRRNREADLAEKRQARREAAEIEHQAAERAAEIGPARHADDLRALRHMADSAMLAGVTAGAFTAAEAVAELRALLAEWEADSHQAPEPGQLRDVLSAAGNIDPSMPGHGDMSRCTAEAPCGDSGCDRCTASSTEPRGADAVAASALEYAAWLDHLCTAKSDGGHGLNRDAARIVAHDLRGAKGLHRMQRWHEPVCPWTPDAAAISRMLDPDPWGKAAADQVAGQMFHHGPVPQVLDMREAPQDHQCSGTWQYAGANRGGHNVYRCDSGRHVAIEHHDDFRHVCNPVACEYPTAAALTAGRAL